MRTLRESIVNINEASINANDVIFIWNYKGTLVVADDSHEFINYLVNEENWDGDDFDEMVGLEEKCRIFSGKASEILKEMSNAGYFWRNLKLCAYEPMKDLLKSINESKNMPQYITVQVPLNDQPRLVDSPKAFKRVRVETRPDFTWEQMYWLNYHDELNWQRRITGNDKLTHEEFNCIHFLVSDDGKTWRIYAMYDTSEEILYCDSIRDAEKSSGSRFLVSMTSANPKM